METNKIPVSERAQGLLIINEMLQKTLFEKLANMNICAKVRNKYRAKRKN